MARVLTDPGSRGELAPLTPPAGAVAFRFDEALGLGGALEALLPLLLTGQRAAGHRRNFGYPHPAADDAAVVADALVSGLNPQLALRREAPVAVALEDAVLRCVGTRLLGSPPAEAVFTSGGAEANFTAVVAALHHAFPQVQGGGLRGLGRAPRVYASSASHGSVRRAVRCAGLGDDALRLVPADRHGVMKIAALAAQVRADRAAGGAPFLVVGTAGTTGLGAVDPLEPLARLARKEGLWLHVDAAWGGLLAFGGRGDALAGIGDASSVCFDPHKALAQPLGTGALFTSVPGALTAAFRMEAEYMPHGEAEPYARGLPWSRRFVGARLLFTLLARGMPALERAAARQLAVGEHLKEALRSAGFLLRSETPMPVACFVDAGPRGQRGAHLRALAAQVGMAGAGHLTLLRGHGPPMLRAAVHTTATDEAVVDELVAALVSGRAASSAARASSPAPRASSSARGPEGEVDGRGFDGAGHGADERRGQHEVHEGDP